MACLPLPIRVEYYDSTQFRANTDDGCSSYAATSVSFSNRQGLTVDPTALGSGQLIQDSLFDDNPSAKITFGIFNREERRVYSREVY